MLTPLQLQVLQAADSPGKTATQVAFTVRRLTGRPQSHLVVGATLHRLKDAGFTESRWENRKLRWQLTAAGKQVLRNS